MQALFGKLSMRSHRDELASAVQILEDRDFVRADRIFDPGNSEDTLHVLNYQLEQPTIRLAGRVLTGPLGRPVGMVGCSQLAEQAATIPNGDRLLELYDQAITRFEAGESMNPDLALPEGVQHILQSLESLVNLPFARELWVAEAATPLARVNVPVLVMTGKKDVQVDWRADGAPR